MALPERIVVSLLLHGSGALGCLNYGKKYFEYEKRKERLFDYKSVELKQRYDDCILKEKKGITSVRQNDTVRRSQTKG